MPVKRNRQTETELAFPSSAGAQQETQIMLGHKIRAETLADASCDAESAIVGC